MATPAFSSDLQSAFVELQTGLEQQLHESIAVRAYELWQERGCPNGSAELDWLAAEAELTQHTTND